ncbi:hypothetical protein V6Z11_D12G116800 [Gossypium hirsutum]
MGKFKLKLYTLYYYWRFNFLPRNQTIKAFGRRTHWWLLHLDLNEGITLATHVFFFSSTSSSESLCCNSFPIAMKLEVNRDLLYFQARAHTHSEPKIRIQGSFGTRHI